MDLATYNNIKEQTEKHIASGASHFSVARNAELLCAKLRFEFHPLICDIVEGAFPVTGRPIPRCGHTSVAGREAAEADFKAASPAEPAPETKPEAKAAKK